MSLHFDGIMLKGDRFCEGTTFKADISLVYKSHKCMLDLIGDAGDNEEGAVVLSEEDRDFELRPNRVIPYHLVVATKQWEVVYRANVSIGEHDLLLR